MARALKSVQVNDSPFTEELTTFRAEFAGSSTNGQGEKSLRLVVDRPDRVGVEVLADMAGILFEVVIRIKPGARRFVLPPRSTLPLPDAEVPGE